MGCELLWILFFSFGATFCSLSLFLFLSHKRSLYNPIQSALLERVPGRSLKKNQTGTMAGIVFIPVALGVTLFYIEHNFFSLSLLVSIFIICLTGAVDDIVKKQNGKGISPFAKSVVHLSIGSWICYLLYCLYDGEIPYYLPWGKEPFFTLSSFGLILFVFFTLFVFSGSSNALNLTDGIDGLACSTASLAYLFFIYLSLSEPLGAQAKLDLTPLLTSFLGALLAFFFFNRFPAKLFMGDAGSLPLGAVLAISAFFLRAELMLAIVGIVFVIETLSVIFQCFTFRYWKKRYFRCTPLHHHFEALGMSENQIVALFFSIGLLGFFVAFCFIIW